MAARVLILLARRFPFNHGEVAAEVYLESEIVHLSRSFDRILAFGAEADHSDAPTCRLPENVIPIPLGCRVGKAEKARMAIRGIGYTLQAPQQVRDALSSDRTVNPARMAFRNYIAARAYMKYKRAARAVQEASLSPTHIYSFWLYDSALAAVWLQALYPQAVLFSRAHGYDVYQERNALRYLPFREYLLNRLGHVFPCSEYGARYISACWPGCRCTLSVSYLGTGDMPDRSGEPAGHPFSIVSCSRVVSVKRVHLIADALALLDAEGVSASWTHIGDGPLLEQVANTVKGFASVKVSLLGRMRHEDVIALYGREHFDLFVNVSSSEGVPISIMEACGTGIPVLTTDVGGTHEIVADGQNGKLLDGDTNPREIADAIVRFMRLSDERIACMRRASREIWERNFRVSNNVRRMMDVVMPQGRKDNGAARWDGSHEMEAR